MKRDLIKGIVLIGAVALSSCSATHQLAGVKSAAYNDDDVYYTRAKAGDKIDDIAYSNLQNNNYKGDDDYYYYGDYASRLNRFSNYSPFDYGDNFYFNYVPYNNGFGEGLDYDRDYYASNYGFSRTANTAPYIDNGNIYSPYDYGYSPFYDMGYDDYGYGDVYSAYLLGGYGGGGGYAGVWRHHNTTTIATTTNPSVRGVRTTPSPGVTRIASLPGRPVVSVNAATGVVTRNINNLNGNNNNNNTASRQTRESYRPQQTQSVAPPPSTSTSSSSSGGSTSSATSSGGGGRPVRP